MKRLIFSFVIFMLIGSMTSAQNNIQLSNPEAEQIMFGNYDPALYTPETIINNPDSILHGIIRDIHKDTLMGYLNHIESYYNRNSGSDTISENYGIGGVRRWIYKKFQEYSAENENRLVVTDMDFDYFICGKNHHKNVLAILPGLDTTEKDMLIIEGHYDTRCEGACDTNCYSPGMEDNGSGTVLVMELARIMSRYAYDHTIVFTCVTGEDQGLYGAKAFSKWLFTNNLPVKAVFNNDVIGGIICGHTSSPPSCPYEGNIDSTHVRIFSYSAGNDTAAVSPHKQLARYIRLHQEEQINPLLSTPMNINLIIAEDRTGRSGDQVPFRQRGYTALRFCAQNENGNGTGTPPDRQHTVNDILGEDLSVPPDGILDTFYVDMNYLKRNAIMNGVNLGLLAISPQVPEPVFNPLPDGIEITMQGNDTLYKHYRVGIRSRGSGTLYFDSVYTFENTTQMLINGLQPDKEYYISVCNVNNGVESIFCDEYTLMTVGIKNQLKKVWGLALRQNRPNPFHDSTILEVEGGQGISYPDASLVIRDISGREITSIPLSIIPGVNQAKFSNSLLNGIYTCTLEIGGNKLQTIKMAVY